MSKREKRIPRAKGGCGRVSIHQLPSCLAANLVAESVTKRSDSRKLQYCQAKLAGLGGLYRRLAEQRSTDE